MSPLKAMPFSIKELLSTDFDRARDSRMRQMQQKMAAEDEARRTGGATRVVAITSFSFEGPDQPNGLRIVHAGEELEIPTFDLDAFAGKVMPAHMFMRRS